MEESSFFVEETVALSGHEVSSPGTGSKPEMSIGLGIGMRSILPLQTGHRVTSSPVRLRRRSFQLERISCGIWRGKLGTTVPDAQLE